jgi:hypothetical protein
MDWRLCVICGGGGDLKCPAKSKQGNGLEIYSNFLKVIAEFQDPTLLPSVKFTEEHDAEMFLKNQAKWHKACHLKFAPSKLIRLQKRKLSCDAATDGEQQQRKSKRQRASGSSDMDSCIFCSEVSGTLHNCETMKLDHNVRRMATELQDSSLLARISGGDLIAIEAKYHYNCLSTFKNKHRSAQRAQNSSINQEDELIQAQVFADLILYIEESIENGTFIFKLSELHSMYVNQLKQYGIEKFIHKTRLKSQILDHFWGDCQEQLSDGKSIVLVFNQGMKKMLKEAVDSRDFESEALAMLKLVKVLRHEIFEWKSFKFAGSFPSNCQSNSIPTTLKLFISLLLHGSNAKNFETQASLTLAQLISKVIGSSSVKSRHSKDREPPIPLFVGLHAHTQTRSKKIVNTLYRLGIGVSYDRVLEIESSLATAVCKRFEEEHLVCPANLRKDLVTVGALDNIDHNPSSTTAQGSFHGTGISIFQIPSHENNGTARDPIVIEDLPSKKYSSLSSLSHNPSSLPHSLPLSSLPHVLPTPVLTPSLPTPVLDHSLTPYSCPYSLTPYPCPHSLITHN